MSKLYNKALALLLLAVYIVNPLHAVLHNHEGGSCSCMCHSVCDEEVSDSEKLYKSSEKANNEIHECFLCKNNQDRTHFLSKACQAECKSLMTVANYSKSYITQIKSSGIFFIESRGPPALS